MQQRSIPLSSKCVRYPPFDDRRPVILEPEYEFPPREALDLRKYVRVLDLEIVIGMALECPQVDF
jgi:hypothetical protein